MKLKNPLLAAADMDRALAFYSRRFLDSGMTLVETAERMDVPVEYVKERAR